MIWKIIERYNDMIKELFCIIGAMLIYLIFAHEWVLLTLFSFFTIIIYRGVKEEIKEIKEYVEESLKEPE